MYNFFEAGISQKLTEELKNFIVPYEVHSRSGQIKFISQNFKVLELDNNTTLYNFSQRLN